LRLDVRRPQIDFLACGGHKWLLGPIGMGFLFVRKDLQSELWPVECGHLSVQQNTEKYTEYKLNFKPSAERFEGGVANYAGVFGLDAALNLFFDVGPAAIEARVLELTDYLCDQVTRRGYRLRSHRGPGEKSGTVSFVSDRHPSKALFERLTAAKIVVTLREGAIRVAPHFFNTHEELDRLLATLPAH
jgi:selenocysteine lyase/cysteine desulfurase